MHKCTTLTCQYSCKIFSRKKSNRDTVQKQHTNKLNRSRPFYLLSIRSKKIDSSEFHKQIQDFELPTSWDFFWRAKKAGKHYQNVSLIPQILHAPFTCYHYILKKFTALNYTNKFMTLICPFISLFFWRGKRAGENYIIISPKAWILHAPFTCYQYVLKKFTALNSINRFITLTCQIIFAFFFCWGKWAGKQYKNMSSRNQILHAPFTCE